jgi:serine-type D-Ala-D-Ala carboxypeptidase/endopeptidase (penicillin-binding protein 4)
MIYQTCCAVKRMFFYMSLLMFSPDVFGQTTASRLEQAFGQFESDGQLKHALVSFYVVNAKTGDVIFDKNSQTGLAPASTQKIITSVTALEIMGKDYRYKTSFGITEYEGQKALYIRPSGDPTLGSWRWENTKDKAIIPDHKCRR